MPESSQLNFSISLPLRNKAGLTRTLHELYDPTSPAYHAWLTSAQFTGQFGPTKQAYDSVIAYCDTNGFRVIRTYANRLLLDVSVPISDIEKAFDVHMMLYKHPIRGGNFYAPDRNPSLDLSTPILSVVGLNNYGTAFTNTKIQTPPGANKLGAQPLSQTKSAPPPGSATPYTNTGSGPGNAYVSADIRAAYANGVSLLGYGQTIGLLEFDGFYTNDIQTYEQTTGLGNLVDFTSQVIDTTHGFNGSPVTTGGLTEVTLDVEMAIAMAPYSNVIVYEASPYAPVYQGFDEILNAMASQDEAKQLSSSWGITGDTVDGSANQSFEEMAAQGQSFFQASGDQDAIINSTVITNGDTVHSYFGFPSDDPYVTAVGGTKLRTTGPGGSYVSELVWNPDLYVEPRHAFEGSSGGVSVLYTIPSWQ